MWSSATAWVSADRRGVGPQPNNRTPVQCLDGARGSSPPGGRKGGTVLHTPIATRGLYPPRGMLQGEKRPGLLPCRRTDAEPIRRPPPLFLTSEATGPRDCGGPIQASWTPAAGDSEAGDGGSGVPQAALLQPQLRFSSGAGRHLVVTPGLTSEAGPEPTHPEHTAESGPDLRVQAHGETEAHGGPGVLWAPRGGRAPDTGPVPNFSLVVLRAPGRVARLKWLT